MSDQKTMLPSHYQPAKNLLADRVIMVTGAGRGIGRAVAIGLAEYGATVVLLGKNLSRLESTYDAIEAAGGARPAMTPLDLEQAEASHFEEVLAGVGNEFGRLDGLLHNAGMLGALAPMMLQDLDLWDRVLRVNTKAPVLLTQALYPLLEKSNDASVIFTSSGVGRIGRAYWGAYAASKFALEGIMQVWAHELEGESKIRCCSLDPGATATAMRTTAYPGEDPHSLPQPQDLLPAYLYLLGPDGIKSNGQQYSARDFIASAALASSHGDK